MDKSFVIFGERCSGTNIIEAAVRLNSELMPTWQFGFKHFPEPLAKITKTELHKLHVVLVIRQPVEWIRSLYAQPWHAAPEVKARRFDEFVVSEWWSVWCEEAGISVDDPRYGTEIMADRDPETGRRFANPLELRNAKYKAFLKIGQHAKSVTVARLEDYVAAPHEFIAELLAKLEAPLPESIRIPAGYKGEISKKRQFLRWLRVEQLFPRRRFRKKPVVTNIIKSNIINMLDLQLERECGYTELASETTERLC